MAVTSDWEPACFDAAELADWSAGRIGACADCEPGWHETSRASGCCNGVPRFAAIPSEEDETMETPATYASGGPTQHLRTRVTVVAPCASCVHARVCRLRPGDELVVAAELPQLDVALTATLTATVECMEYAKAPRAAARMATGGGASDQARDWNGGPIQRGKRSYSPEALERLRAGARKASAVKAAKKAGAAA